MERPRGKEALGTPWSIVSDLQRKSFLYSRETEKCKQRENALSEGWFCCWAGLLNGR